MMSAWGHIGKAQFTPILHDVAKIVPGIVPAGIWFSTDAVAWRETRIPALALTVDHIWIHEQHLIAAQEVLPGIVPVSLTIVVPHAKIRMIGVIYVDLTGWISASAGGGRRDSDGWGDPIGVAVEDCHVIATGRYPEADRMPKWLGGFEGPDM
jgi:hypothetical protein